MKQPLKKCCNGCDAPPHPPSWVLCRECFMKLDKSMQAMERAFESAKDPA